MIHEWWILKGFGRKLSRSNRDTFWCLLGGTDGNREAEDSRSPVRERTDHWNTNKSARATCAVCVMLFTGSIETGVQKVKIQILLKSCSCAYITFYTISCCLIDKCLNKVMLEKWSMECNRRVCVSRRYVRSVNDWWRSHIREWVQSSTTCLKRK